MNPTRNRVHHKVGEGGPKEIVSSTKMVESIIDQLVENLPFKKKPNRIIIQEVDHIPYSHEDCSTVEVVVYESGDGSGTVIDSITNSDSRSDAFEKEAQTFIRCLLDALVDESVTKAEEHILITREMDEMEEVLGISISVAESHINELICRDLLIELANNAVGFSLTKVTLPMERRLPMRGGLRKNIRPILNRHNNSVPYEEAEKENIRPSGSLFKTPQDIRRDVLNEAVKSPVKDFEANGIAIGPALERPTRDNLLVDPQALGPVVTVKLNPSVALLPPPPPRQQQDNARKRPRQPSGEPQASKPMFPEHLSKHERLALMYSDRHKEPLSVLCRTCPSVTPANNEEFMSALDKYVISLASNEENLWHMGLDFINHPVILNRTKSFFGHRLCKCTCLPHPSLFFDPVFFVRRARFPIYDPSNPALVCLNGITGFLLSAYPRKGECYCMMYAMCHFCRYFFFTLTTIAHCLNISISEDALDLHNYVTYLAEFIHNDPFSEEHSKSICSECRLPYNGHEDPNEFEGFPKCEGGIFSGDGRNGIGEFIYLFELKDFQLGRVVSESFQTWTHEIHVITRRTGNWTEKATRIFEEASQLTKMAMPLNDLTAAFVAFNRLLYLKPIFKHDEGTSHPINTVLSLKRLFQFLQFMMLKLLPMVVVEKVHRKTRNEVAMQNELNLEQTRRLKKKCGNLQASKLKTLITALLSTSAQSIGMIDEIYNTGTRYSCYEVMANLHRFNNSKQLQRYVNSYWGRVALITSFKNALCSVITMCDYARLDPEEVAYFSIGDFAFYGQMEVLNKWLLALHTDLAKVRQVMSDDNVNSTDKKSSAKQSPTSFLLYQVMYYCHYCGLPPKKSLKICEVCNIARYCSDACMKKCKAHHEFLCTDKGVLEMMTVFGKMGPAHCEALVVANRRARKGHVFNGPLIDSSGLVEDDAFGFKKFGKLM